MAKHEAAAQLRRQIHSNIQQVADRANQALGAFTDGRAKDAIYLLNCTRNDADFAAAELESWQP